jgi:hypothetical protein
MCFFVPALFNFFNFIKMILQNASRGRRGMGPGHWTWIGGRGKSARGLDAPKCCLAARCCCPFCGCMFFENALGSVNTN